MTTTFLLIRHAPHARVADQLTGRSEGASLDDAGREQAAALAARLAPLPLAALYSSPMARTRETAELVAAPHRLPVRISAALNEVDFGEWAGRPFDTLADEARWQQWNGFRSGTRAPGGELMVEVQARVMAELVTLRARHPDALVALVSHADVIRAALLHLLGAPLDHFLRLAVEPASVSVVALHEWGATLLALNHTGPLPTLAC